MAREFAQIKLSIWADDDWRDLSPMARYLYLTLLTSPSLSHCGVADWRPARIGALNGMSPRDVESFGAELVEALYLVIDEESEEVLIRSFIRNDGLMKQPKMAVAMASAHAAVASKDLRSVIVHELKRLREDLPDLNGWGSERATDLLGLRSVDPSTYPCGKGKWTPIGKGSTKGSPTPAPTPTPTPSSLSPSQTAADAASCASADAEREFDEWYAAYPRKRGKGQAIKAYKTARKKADAETLLTAVKRQTPALTARGPEYVPYPATWLNGERWEDEPDNVHRLHPETDEQGRVILPPLPKRYFDQ